MSVRVAAAARLHFGLIRPHPPEDALCRRFGGVGMMVADVGMTVRVESAADWSAEGPLADRALEFARRLATSLPGGVPPHRITVEGSPPEHAGLGTGTQLALAVGRALSLSAGLGSMSATELAVRLGRGARSAVGIHGFDRGGLIVEAGKRPGEPLGVLVGHAPLPTDWRLVLARPALPSGGVAGLSGPAEQAVFASSQKRAGVCEERSSPEDSLCRLALTGLLPAAWTGDWPAFGAALGEYNARAGDWFAAEQGGRYAHPAIARLVAFCRERGVPGAGQSSWGPTVFAVVPDADRAAWLADRLRLEFGDGLTEVTISRIAPSRADQSSGACQNG